MNLLYRVTLKEGYTSVVKREEENAGGIELGIIRLGNGKLFNGNSGNNEIGLVILGGKCSLKANEFEWKEIGDRDNVFDGKAFAAYIPPGTDYEFTGIGRVEVAVCRVPSDSKSSPKLITPDDVKERTAGRGNWKRSIYDIIDVDVEAEKLVLGETISPPGNWSSFPPHKHDVDAPPDESKLEEIYFYKVDPPQGFGIQRVYTEDGSIDEVYTVMENDAVLIPSGYHPVVAAAGYRLYYLWILAGEKRILKPRNEPKHEWILK
jgi:5-deoxy-glucuronate isomerase